MRNLRSNCVPHSDAGVSVASTRPGFFVNFFRGSKDRDKPVRFRDVFEQELLRVKMRRQNARYDQVDADPRANCVGVALSGGGIRSGTFSLGLLQGLHALGVLRAVDYLSTVSGGGYVGGWWTAWLSRERDRDSGEHFPNAERIEPERTADYALGLPAGAQEAKVDPIHHLRLFGNYLTPRKGLLSGDTWRAAAVVSRNLILTWLVLVPVLLGVVLLGQLYFVAQPFNAAVAVAFVHHQPEDPSAQVGDSAFHPDPKARGVRTQRLQVAARPLVALFLLLMWVTAIWMHFSNGGTRLTHFTNAGVIVVMIVAGIWSYAAGPPQPNSPPVTGPRRPEPHPWWDLSRWAPWGLSSWDVWLAGVTVVAAAVVLGFVLWPERGSWSRGGPVAQARANRATRFHSRLLIAFVATGTVLLFAGFAHEAPATVRELFGPNRDRVLGGLAGIITVASTIFTAFKAAPAGGRDAREIVQPSLASRAVFAITPPLVVTLLAAIGAIVIHRVMFYVLRDYPMRLEPLTIASLAGLLLCLIFAAWENWTMSAGATRVPWAYPVATFLVFLAVVAAGVRMAIGPSVEASVSWLLTQAPSLVYWRWAGAFVAFATAVAVLLLRGRSPRVRFLLAFIAVTLGAVLLVTPEYEAIWRAGQPPPGRSPALLTGLVLLGLLGGWVVALGWMADPNTLALHGFYKARLVRAYLGASNAHRRKSGRDISEPDAQDDVRMKDVTGWKQGGPYPLINTTLNLVGGHDLVTAQRSAAHFLMSPCYCGSERTGYRPTNDYMNGELTLGTAIATSGAAVSPNMGSETPSAALALLLAFLNIRLGTWVPTPDKARWREAQMRLWPGSLLRECLSQTTDTSSYCYLTDGGHFDNTGLYPLVARACRLIILSDNGADPDPCFADLGVAIRRCRIDFKAEIMLDLKNFRPICVSRDARLRAIGHVTFGKILYQPGHLETLGWDPQEIKKSTAGTIVWIKPAVLDDDPAADVLQYGLEKSAFPQQSTLNQWFDESQFESYRKLGELSAHAAFDTAVQRTQFVGPTTLDAVEKLRLALA